MQSYWSAKNVKVNFGDVCKYISIVGCEKIILGKGRIERTVGRGRGGALTLQTSSAKTKFID